MIQPRCVHPQGYQFFHYMIKVKDVQRSHVQALTLEPKPLTQLYPSHSLLSTL